MNDDLATPLWEVTFVVVDLETTGGSPATDRITEIGALKVRGGELLARFETLVNPGVPIPPLITTLTGITEAMVLPAPEVREVLPAFLEFTRGAVIVGHNVRFDWSFLNAALIAHGYHRLPNRRVDTLGLARRLVHDELPNHRLHTLAAYFHATTEPVHRAYADAAATVEVFHSLLEHAGTYGVLGLDDLLAFPRIRLHRTAGKLALTAKLPRDPGVYMIRDRRGAVLFVGWAANLRTRVRSHFSGSDRRRVPQLLFEAADIEHRVCEPQEAIALEQRLIERHRPRYNRRTKRRHRSAQLAGRAGSRVAP
jgi:DNA polymerase-3 subunit epsilon